VPDVHIHWLDRIAEIDARCSEILSLPEFEAIPGIAATVGMGPPQLHDLVVQTARTGIPLELWEQLVRASEKHGIPENGYVLQRFLLLIAGTANLRLVPDLPVADEVKDRLLNQFLYVCAPDREMTSLLNPRHYGFRVMCKFMLLERFPAGQSDWEISGFPRSWLAKMPVRDLPRALKCVYLRAGGRRPFFVSHTAFRRDLPIITEEDERTTFRLLAASMRLQPTIRGYLASGWFMDPKLSEVSPHLAWLSHWYRECEEFGAVWTNIGEAPRDGGFTVGDRRRRKLYETGHWKPLEGALIWERRDLLRWHDWNYSK
jgi:hypothetical protein